MHDQADPSPATIAGYLRDLAEAAFNLAGLIERADDSLLKDVVRMAAMGIAIRCDGQLRGMHLALSSQQAASRPAGAPAAPNSSSPSTDPATVAQALNGVKLPKTKDLN